jgi:hypothetical protein
VHQAAFSQCMGGSQVELVLLDGVLYKERGGDTRRLSYEELRACMKPLNHKVGSGGAGAAVARRSGRTRAEGWAAAQSQAHGGFGRAAWPLAGPRAG